MDTNVEKRTYDRKSLDPIHVADMTTIDRQMLLARYGTILNASATGLLIRVSPGDLGPEILQHAQGLEAITGAEIVMTIAEMALKIDGRVVRTHHTDQGFVDIAVDYTDNAPAYWRECLVDLLPNPGEIDKQAGAL